MIIILLNNSYLGVAIFLNLGQLRTTSGQVNFMGYLSDGQVVFKSCSEHCLHGVNSQTIITIAKPLCKYVLHFEIWAKLQIHK